MGPQKDIDPQTYTTVDMPSYTFTNLKMGYQLTPKSEFYTKINNITNTKYESVKGYPGQERNIFLGYTQGF